jgi:glycosyltransferase involved in cell wall biosynthesis
MKAPPKVLHIVESLHRGAVEGWLVRMLRHAKFRKIPLDWSFYCQLDEKGDLETDALNLGAKVTHSPEPIGRKMSFIKALRSELYRGKYDVIHCHHDLVSVVYLIAAFGVPLVRRLVHVHNADECVLSPSKAKQALLRPLMRRCCHLLADRIVGISDHTLDTFLAGRRRRAGTDLLHYYGIEPTAFERCFGDRKQFRHVLGLPADSRVLLFAGRIVLEKNPLFAVEVFAEMKRLDDRVVCVFVGSGSLEGRVLARITELGLDASFRFLGWRNDIPEVMCCCDWFILPRPEFPQEGLGIAVVEAQLAGLHLILSRGIPDDALLPSASALRLSLALTPSEWAKSALAMVHQEDHPRQAAIAALAASPFAMDTALEALINLHN